MQSNTSMPTPLDAVMSAGGKGAGIYSCADGTELSAILGLEFENHREMIDK